MDAGGTSDGSTQVELKQLPAGIEMDPPMRLKETWVSIFRSLKPLGPAVMVANPGAEFSKNCVATALSVQTGDDKVESAEGVTVPPADVNWVLALTLPTAFGLQLPTKDDETGTGNDTLPAASGEASAKL